MPKKNHSVLLARMDLVTDSFVDMKIAVLIFPFAKEVQSFCRDIQQALRSQDKIYAQYRQLNNAILACTSTLTYGFEKFTVIDNISQYRTLAVGTAAELNIPTPEQIYELIYLWAKTWTKQYLGKKGNQEEIKSVCDRFLKAIDTIPRNWEWEYIQPETLIQNITSNNDLGYQAIPSLLVTLLHEQSCTISSGDGEQKLRWRKVQGDGSTKTGLHLVSQPFKATYIDDDDNEREGYYAYRLDFHLQTQAGRSNSEGHLKPWIFIHLSCQRYAHEPLVEANYGRNISILMGMNQARLDNYPIDSTLVRLTIKNNTRKYWQEQLPELLTAFKARSLIAAQDILNYPSKFCNLDNVDNWSKDEYYLVHAEGYEYKQEEQKGRGHGHYIKTGFSLKERADIINQVLQLLNGVLIPDRAMECDIPVPTGKKLPLAMSDHELHRKSLRPSEIKKIKEDKKQQYIKEKQNIIEDALKRAANSKQIYLFIIYYEEHTKILVHQQLRKAFLLQQGDDFPEEIKIIDVLINDSNLLEKLSVSGLPSGDNNKNFDKELKKEHNKKRQDWQNFLKINVLPLVEDKINYNLFAIIEIGQSKAKGIHPKQSIYGAVREACVLENINSQMLQTVKPKDKENPQDDTTYSKATEGRVLNAVLDVILRQTGTLYGLPSEVYQVAGIPEDITQKLDVIAFCRVQKHNFIGLTPFQYAVVVRLSATGTVDVLLPHQQQWIPYSQAGIAIGQLFHQARKARNATGKAGEILNQIQMKGGQLVKFVADVLTQHLENPTIALIEADVWRNERSKMGNNDQAWFQLKNEYLFKDRDILNFNHVPGHSLYQRDDKKFENLLGIIRIRGDRETPQYATNKKTWEEDYATSDFTQLSGFIDQIVPELLHYFSVGRIPDTQKKKQDTPKARKLYKSDRSENVYAANIAYKHQQMLEILPFFVHPDFQTEDNLKALCRVPHFIRTSPSFTKGNIKHPYPMHLGIELIKDLLCILDLEV